MLEVKFLIDFYKLLYELLNLGEYKFLWCSWDFENGLSYIIEKENYYFKDILIKFEICIVIIKVEISIDFKKYEEYYVFGENL